MKITFLAPIFIAWFVLISGCKQSTPNSATEHEKKPAAPKNIVLVIGDGTGINQISALEFYKEGPIYYDDFPVVGLSKVSSTSLVTDSAAAGTAMACGQKTYNKAIGVDVNGQALPSITEYMAQKGGVNGIISTSSITHATPACFFAHHDDRNDHEIIENPIGLFFSVIIGLGVGLLVGQISEWFTSDHYSIVKNIADQAKTGPATLVLSGISEGMRSAAYSVVVVVFGIYGAYTAGDWALGADGGIYGIAIAAIGVLSTLGITVAVDAYGPIADNAGGIAEMAHLPPEVREATDELDSLGNTTAAIAKGFAIGSAAVTALALFSVFVQSAGIEKLDITEVEVTLGLFLGGMFPFLFAAMTINAVGRAAFKMIEEVRRQFNEIPGLREGKEGVVPDYTKCVDIATTAALKEMLLPGGLAIALPLIIGFWDKEALGGFLAGSLVTGFLLAIFMANSGGAWDNAKKYIEAGGGAGKGSDEHKAAVIGDTIGDPFKDTSGPAMNIVIKVMTIVSLIFASAF